MLWVGLKGTKGFRDGTHRTISPAETVERVRRYMPVMGITRLATVTGLDRVGVPVVMVCRPNARSLAVSQGKGLSLAAARASGLMEAVEAYHAERITLPLKLCSYQELRYTHTVVDPLRLPRPRQTLVDLGRPMLWIEGHDLLRDEAVWLPYEVVHTNYTMAYWRQAWTFLASSNGLASGNHPLEAISHAICEVVERDASALWSVQSAEHRQNTRVDLNTVDDPACCSILDRFKGASLLATVWETTSDIGIPAFHCVIAERSNILLHPLYPAFGRGCHPVRSIALLRALTEAAQSRLTAIVGARDDLVRERYTRFSTPVDAEEQQTLPGGRPFAGSSWDGATLEEDVAWELDRLRDAGIERVIAVDLSKPEFGIPVVRIVIPGLEYLPRNGLGLPGERARRVACR